MKNGEEEDVEADGEAERVVEVEGVEVGKEETAVDAVALLLGVEAVDKLVVISAASTSEASLTM